MWFLRFLSRLDEEMREVNALLKEGWVKSVGWRIDSDGILRADVCFEGGGKTRRVSIAYPHVYPYAPPQVFPSDNQRWSIHQWPTGELCLEIRADNWRTNYNGSRLLRSARLLLDTEGEKDERGQPRRVTSAHSLTEGQRLRGHPFRLIMNDDVVSELKRRGERIWRAEFRTTWVEDSCVVVAAKLSAIDGGAPWKSDRVPQSFSDSYKVSGLISLIKAGDKQHLALTAAGIGPVEIWAKFSDEPFDSPRIVVGVLGEQVIGRYLGAEETWELGWISMDSQNRSPSRNNALATKHVGVVGCGSIGSKIAASLARSGVENFVLIDGDVLKEGNLVRHDLDWGTVGAHKVDGLAQRLVRINPQISITKWVGQLGGQNSTDYLLKGLSMLGKCDLIIEVTGSAQGFSYAGAVAAQHRIPMVWGCVFAGGYGGLVARSRPGLDPTPHEVRTLIDHWCANPEFPPPPKAAITDYGAEADDQPAMIADDGDVSVIAMHLTRMATDALRPPSESDYPYSAYMIGLRKEWIFNQPYQTFPIDLPESAAKLPHRAWATTTYADAITQAPLPKQLPTAPYPKKKCLMSFFQTTAFAS